MEGRTFGVWGNEGKVELAYKAAATSPTSLSLMQRYHLRHARHNGLRLHHHTGIKARPQVPAIRLQHEGKPRQVAVLLQ